MKPSKLVIIACCLVAAGRGRHSLALESPASAAAGTRDADGGIASLKTVKDGKKSILFDRPFDDLVIGGEGRYNVLHFPAFPGGQNGPSSDRKTDGSIPAFPPAQEGLVVWDLLTMEVAFRVPIEQQGKPQPQDVPFGPPYPNTRFAADLDQLVIYTRASNKFHRWSLSTGKESGVSANPFKGFVCDLAMGSGSKGPLALVIADGDGTSQRDPQRVFFVDPVSLRPLGFDEPFDSLHNLAFDSEHRFSDGVAIRPATNGMLFTFIRPYIVPTGLDYLSLGSKVSRGSKHASYGQLLPSPDGAYIFSARGVIRTDDPNHGVLNPGEWGMLGFPAVTGPYYLELDSKSGPLSEAPWQLSDPFQAILRVRVAGKAKPLKTMFDAAPLTWTVKNPHFPAEKRIHLVPKANCLLIVPDKADRLDLYRVDLDQILASLHEDYLFVTSRAPSVLKKGSQLQYQVEVRSSSGAPSFKLDLAPPGATITPTGQLDWAVAGSDKPTFATSIVHISGPKGQTVYHSFGVRVE